MTTTKYKPLIIDILLGLLAYTVWQWDHSFADLIWDNPAMHVKGFDGWFLGPLSGIDIYNTLMVFFLIVIFGGLIVNNLAWKGISITVNTSLQLSREHIIGVLIIIEAFLAPFVLELNMTGKIPDRVKTISMLGTAILIGITYFLKYLGFENSGEKK